MFSYDADTHESCQLSDFIHKVQANISPVDTSAQTSPNVAAMPSPMTISPIATPLTSALPSTTTAQWPHAETPVVSTRQPENPDNGLSRLTTAVEALSERFAKTEHAIQELQSRPPLIKTEVVARRRSDAVSRDNRQRGPRDTVQTMIKVRVVYIWQTV